MQYIADKELIAACGLYCGTCRAYRKQKCPGCSSPQKEAAWCKLRSCCLQKGIQTCAECNEYGSETSRPLRDCHKFNNPIGKLFGIIFRSDRHGCIERIREVGSETFAQEMAEAGCYNRPVTGRK